jgi:BMFP domain-containing protein YqiC
VAQNARHRMSVIKREHYPATKARRLIYLAEQCERLADELERLEAKDKEAKERRVEIGYVGDDD